MLLPLFALLGKLRPCLSDPNPWIREERALEAYRLFPILLRCDSLGKRSSFKKILCPMSTWSGFTDLISIELI